MMPKDMGERLHSAMDIFAVSFSCLNKGSNSYVIQWMAMLTCLNSPLLRAGKRSHRPQIWLEPKLLSIDGHPWSLLILVGVGCTVPGNVAVYFSYFNQV